MKQENENDGIEHPEIVSFDQLSNPQLTQTYIGKRREYRDLLRRAERVSRGSAGIPSTGNRMFWASIIFTRIVVTAKSINLLLPDPKPREHWDFSAVASLVRNLLEAILVYNWLCGRSVKDDVREGRFILLYLHDYGSRRRLFPENFDENDPIHQDLVKQFDSNSHLAALDDRQRNVALKGEKTPFVQDD